MIIDQDSLHQHQHTSNESGQSTIEFLSTFAFVFAMLFLFIKIALNFTNGYLVQYANYMASRAYLVHDTNQAKGTALNSAYQRAAQVFGQYQVTNFLPNFSGTLQVNSPTSGSMPFYVGTYVDFEDKFSLSKIMGGAIPLQFRSESFLGKEPLRKECSARVCDAMTAAGGNCSAYSTPFDNGC